MDLPADPFEQMTGEFLAELHFCTLLAQLATKLIEESSARKAVLIAKLQAMS
jgi:hypothetical protein